MRPQLQGEPCVVPGCSRRRKSEVPFCERCWNIAEDGWRTQVQVALHAPFWTARWSEKYEPGDVLFDGVPLPVNHGSPYVDFNGSGSRHQVHFARVLQEFEQRTTIREVANLIHSRRHFATGLIEGEHHERSP